MATVNLVAARLDGRPGRWMAGDPRFRISPPPATMWRLTPRERTVLWTVVALLLVGWGVRTWRAAHPISPAPPPAAR
ncbi:MAG TPA: hypothetical protein P5555_05375 [Candidatus Paceibacterota bacterium]|nr:hypothetical protein [Verrucomicrobiota bacterium]HOX01924.1 hypothetical protein [Verrucomicrobiota bacterium]HRZ44602.1 hypothetical protein [Candidatus Paceibacterota bacterium]HRZ94586.1 hypothetical protein [Candidatus Paceibacterota bacterium]